MGKNLATQVIGLLEHDRVDLRAAAATVLAAVGEGDSTVQKGLVARLDDADAVVRRIALEGLVSHGATGIAANLVAILKRDDEALAERIKRQIRRNTTPRHVPARVIQVADIPRTKSGKIVELAIRQVVHGEAVKNTGALANPDALEQFRGRVELAR